MDLKFSQILLIGYRRPDLTFEQLQVLNLARTKSVHIAIDLSDKVIKQKFEAYLLNYQNNFPNITNLTVDFRNIKMGMVQNIHSAICEQFQMHEKLLIFEDDILFTEQTLINLNAILDHYEKAKDFGAVSAFSPLSAKLLPMSSNSKTWRKSIYFPCWGWGTTRQVWQKYNLRISKQEILDLEDTSKTWNNLNNHQKKVWRGRFYKSHKNPERTWDTQFQFLLFKRDLKVYLPMITYSGNIGFNDANAVNTFGKKPFWVQENVSNLDRRNNIKFVRKIMFRVFMFIDSNTFAGDTRVFKFYGKFKILINKLSNK